MPGLIGTESVLGALIKANIDAVTNKQDRDALFEAMAKAILEHIVANAVVTVTVGGITSGPSAAAGTGVVG